MGTTDLNKISGGAFSDTIPSGAWTPTGEERIFAIIPMSDIVISVLQYENPKGDNAPETDLDYIANLRTITKGTLVRFKAPVNAITVSALCMAYFE